MRVTLVVSNLVKPMKITSDITIDEKTDVPHDFPGFLKDLIASESGSKNAFCRNTEHTMLYNRHVLARAGAAGPLYVDDTRPAWARRGW